MEDINDINATLISKIYNVLKKRIINLEFQFNENINVSEEAKKFKVSQTPVRDALNILAKDGLVTVKPRKGYFVANITKRKLYEIYEIRKMMECFALENLEDKNLSVFKYYLEKILKIYEEGAHSFKNIKEFNELDRDLHLTIVKKSENKMLIEMFLQNYSFVQLSQNFDNYSERSISEIRKLILLLEKIIAKDFHTAKIILIEHIENCRSIGISSMKKYIKIGNIKK